ncbi:hypothetical protein D3C79_919380 [compost metagenome]
MCALGIGPPADADVAFVLGVLDCIEHQIGKGTAQFRLAALQLDARRSFQADALVARPGQGLGVVLDGGEQGIDRHRLVVRWVIGGFQFGQ